MTANSKHVDKAERNGASSGKKREKKKPTQKSDPLNNDKFPAKHIRCGDAHVRDSDDAADDDDDDDIVNDGDDSGLNPMVQTEEEGFETPDGGWGWIVLTGCCSITTLTFVVGPSFGVFFSRFLLDLGTSSSTTAWIFNIFFFLWMGSGMFVRPVIKEFGWRPLAFIGTLLNAACFCITAFAPSAEFLFFSFSVVGGIGGGILSYICYTILPHFFYKHRGLVNGIMMSAVCVGHFLGPPIVRYLQDEYGFTGAMLIVGAIMMNACAGALVLHPVEWHLKRVQVPIITITQDLPSTSHPKRKDIEKLTRDLVKSRSGLCLGDSLGALEIEISDISNAFQRHDSIGRIRRYSSMSRSSSRARMRNFTISECGSEELKAIVDNIAAVDQDITEIEKDKRNGFQVVVEMGKLIGSSVVSDLSQITSPTVFILSVGAIGCNNGYLNFLMQVPFAMQAAGHSLEACAWCLSVAAVTNMMARLISSVLADCPGVNAKFCYITGVLLMATTMFTFPFVTGDLTATLVVMALWGCGVGTSISVYNLVLLSIVGLDRLASLLGTSNFMVALGFLVSGPIVGYVRDSTGSYAASIWVLSGLMSMTLILWGFLPLALDHDKKKKKKKEEALKEAKILA